MTIPPKLPRYRALKQGSRSRPPGASWGLFGSDDRVGTLNLITEETVARAAQLVHKGVVFSLNWELTKPDPPLFPMRHLPTHSAFDRGNGIRDDYFDGFYPQLSSQWDSLAHVTHPDYGDYNFGTYEAGTLATIEHWARRGIAGRFVLADVERYLSDVSRPINPQSRVEVTPEDLDTTLAAQRVALKHGDILLIHFGWLKWYESADPETRAGAVRQPPVGPGISGTEASAEWLWDHRVAAVACDVPALEAMPFETPLNLHRRLIPLLGMAVGELFVLHHLAADCAEDGVYEGLFTAAPLNMPGGIGSTANALALK